LNTLLITGGLGFLGERLLAKIPSQPYERVVCLYRPSAGHNSLAGRGSVEFLPASLPSGLAACERKLAGTETVVHLAAVTGKTRRERYFEVNLEGTRALLEMCRRIGVSRFLFVSSIAAAFPDKRHYYYAQSKEQAEHIVRSSGLRYTILRPTMILGRRAQIWQGLSRLASLPLVPVFGTGRTMIQPIWVDDLAAFMIEILKTDRFHNETLEIGGLESISIEQFLVRASRLLRKAEPRVVHVPLTPIRTALAWMEPLFLSILPFTAGQLASFRFDGILQSNALMLTPSVQPQFRTIDQMLATLCG
jgi:nucleoside-diphosphate-sugar epimerase